MINISEISIFFISKEDLSLLIDKFCIYFYGTPAAKSAELLISKVDELIGQFNFDSIRALEKSFAVLDKSP